MNAFAQPRPLLDEQLDALAHIKRRRLLVALVENDLQGGTPIEIDGWGDDAGTREVPATMQHHHLPKLEDLGFVRWDRASNRVTRGPQFREIEPLVALLYEYRDELPDEWL